MGGNLAWTIRLKDGTQHRMDRWTNAMPNLIVNPAFLHGAPEAIDAALQSWFAMKTDWEEHGPDGPFVHPMTPVYAPYPFGLQPSEYGLVVTDFQTNTILSLQGYSNFGTLFPMRQLYGADARSIDPERDDRLRTLAEQGHIQSWMFLLRTEAATHPFAQAGWCVTPNESGDAWMVSTDRPITVGAVDELCDAARDAARTAAPTDPVLVQAQAMLDAMDPAHPEYQQAHILVGITKKAHEREHNPFILGKAVLNLAPFTLEEFPETADGYKALRARVLELGFALDGAENAAWDARIQRQQDNEGA